LRLPWPQSITPVPGGSNGRSVIFPPQLRNWSPIWVDRTGHDLSRMDGLPREALL